VAKIKGKPREEAEGPNPENELKSLTERALHAARPHLRAIAIGLVAFVVVAGGLSIWSSMRDRKAGEATAELAKVLDVATASVDEAGPEIDPSDPTAGPRAAKFKTFKDRSEAVLAAHKALESSFGSSTVTERAALVQAGALYDLGKFDDAIAAYGTFLKSAPSVELTALAKEGMGYAQEAKALALPDAAARQAGLDTALETFASIDTDEQGPHYTQAIYHQARIKALKGDKAGAAELFKKVLERNPNPLLTEEVQGRLALLDTNAK
jgi:tetratricopeptide (TPR) repeat protein